MSANRLKDAPTWSKSIWTQVTLVPTQKAMQNFERKTLKIKDKERYSEMESRDPEK